VTPLTAVMPASQIVLRALVLLGPVVALLAAGPAGHWPPWWIVLAVVALSGGFAARPDSPLGATVFLAVLVWWTISLPDALHAEVVVAAAALVVAHVAALVAAYGPDALPVEAATLRLWALRCVLVLVTVPAAWGAAVLLRGEPEQPGVWILGVVGALAATVAATVALGTVDRDA
jgi:hypothetical protein